MQAVQAQRNQPSRHAARPPASDPLHSAPPRRPQRHRRRGGQPGHPHTLVPVEAVAAVVGLKPAPCPYCQAPGAGDDPTPWRPHVIALPPIKPVVTASHGQQVVCAACGAVSRAPWPKGGPSGTAGPRGQATVALCRGASRLAKRTPHAVMAEVCGVPRRVGTISPWAQATAEALAAPGEEARTYVHAHEVAHLEETSGRQGGTPAWGGVAVTSRVTGGVVRRSRGGQVARALLGEGLRGILVTERSSASPWSPVRWRQRCWAHVLRDVDAMRGRGGRSAAIGEAWLALAHQRGPWGHRVRAGTRQRATCRSSMRPIRREVDRR